MLPIYKIEADLQDPEVCFNFNSLVDIPAHLRAFEKYGEHSKREAFMDNAKMRVTGVMIAVNVPIFRNCPVMGEHFVVFTPEETEKLYTIWNERGFRDNLNLQHSDKNIVDRKRAFMYESWVVDYANNKGVPKSLENQGIQDGSIMYTYQIKDKELWADVTSGKYNGFSVEGLFVKSLMSVNKGEKFRFDTLNQEQKDIQELREYLKKNHG